MDGAQAIHLYFASRKNIRVSRRTWGELIRLCVGMAGANSSADLGGSSKYSRETLED